MFFHDQVEAVHVGEGCHRDRPLRGIACRVHDVRTCYQRSEPSSWGELGSPGILSGEVTGFFVMAKYLGGEVLSLCKYPISA